MRFEKKCYIIVAIMHVLDIPTGVFPLDYPENYFDYFLVGNCLGNNG